MSSTLAITAGAIATVTFALSALPMLGKALRTRDVSSYSRTNLVLANVGNLLYSVYVFDLPPGPIWLLHGFYLVSSALMLLWSLLFAPVAHTVAHTGSTHTTRSQPCQPSGSRP